MKTGRLNKNKGREKKRRKWQRSRHTAAGNLMKEKTTGSEKTSCIKQIKKRKKKREKFKYICEIKEK